MDSDVPYMQSVKNLGRILDKIQTAGVPDAFGLDFLKDLGFASSSDRAFIKLLKFLGMLDNAGKPQASYREFVDHTKSKAVLAARLQAAYDDLFLANKQAHTVPTEQLKGWFKTKTGASDAVAKKVATTFKALAKYADFEATPARASQPTVASPPAEPAVTNGPTASRALDVPLGLTYRIEVHLPDTTNVDTFRAIFRALREELMP